MTRIAAQLHPRRAAFPPAPPRVAGPARPSLRQAGPDLCAPAAPAPDLADLIEAWRAFARRADRIAARVSLALAAFAALAVLTGSIGARLP